MDYTEEQDLPRPILREVVDLCLRFPDKDTAVRTLYEYDHPLFRNIDTIGIIYKPTGEMLQGEDGPYPEMAPVEGWHVNIRLMPDEELEPLEPYLVYPNNPVRVWA
jgi:hypothetical protein